MKEFGPRDFQEAVDYSDEGGQALLIRKGMSGYSGAPECFKRSPEWGYLYDQDASRLEETVKALGVKRVKIFRRGQKAQYSMLCGRPLKKAIDKSRKNGETDDVAPMV